MRGDVFGLMEPDPTAQPVTPERIGRAATALMELVAAGSRTAGPPELMACLTSLAELAVEDPGAVLEPRAAYTVLRDVRAQLVELGRQAAAPLPWPKISERTVVLPQSRSATLVRAVAAGEVYFVLTREVTANARPDHVDFAFPEGRPEDTSALGPPSVPPVDVTYRLFRYGPDPSDIRMVMRIVQEAGTYRPVLCVSDGDRIAVLSRDVLGIFNQQGEAALSGRVPLDQDMTVGAAVTSMALAGDIMALAIRPARDEPVELAIMNVAEKKGLPVGVVGHDANALTLGEKQAYVVDGLNLVRVPLFDKERSGVDVFWQRPWFAEYPYNAHRMMAHDDDAVWLSDGRKIVILADDLSHVRTEITLQDPILDLDVHDGRLSLVTFEPELAVAKITTYEVT